MMTRRVSAALGKMLTAAGYEVILAADGTEATRLWREHKPDLVILDLHAGDVLQDARLLGAVATIEKPFEKQAMMDLVARSLESN